MKTKLLLGVFLQAIVKLSHQGVNVGLARRQSITTPGHVDTIATAACDVFHQVNAAIGEGHHRRMRPPIAVILARLRRSEPHRLRAINQRDICDPVMTRQVISRRDPDNSGTDDSD